MGDGKKLKEWLDRKGTNVRRIAKETSISPTTLYTIIQKDANIRDFGSEGNLLSEKQFENVTKYIYEFIISSVIHK